MVLARYDIERSEDEIYFCCQTDLDGTPPTAAALCAQSLGIGLPHYGCPAWKPYKNKWQYQTLFQ